MYEAEHSEYYHKENPEVELREQQGRVRIKREYVFQEIVEHVKSFLNKNALKH